MSSAAATTTTRHTHPSKTTTTTATTTAATTAPISDRSKRLGASSITRLNRVIRAQQQNFNCFEIEKDFIRFAVCLVILPILTKLEYLNCVKIN